MKAQGTVFKYGDNIDTDIIIPARYLNTSDSRELAAHCMEPVDEDFFKNVKEGDIMVGWIQLWVRLLQRTCAYCHKGVRRLMCHSKIFCQNILPQRHKHRSCHNGMS